jgi:heterodisulfide reductase subunit B
MMKRRRGYQAYAEGARHVMRDHQEPRASIGMIDISGLAGLADGITPLHFGRTT